MLLRFIIIITSKSSLNSYQGNRIQYDINILLIKRFNMKINRIPVNLVNIFFILKKRKYYVFLVRTNTPQLCFDDVSVLFIMKVGNVRNKRRKCKE